MKIFHKINEHVKQQGRSRQYEKGYTGSNHEPRQQIFYVFTAFIAPAVFSNEMICCAYYTIKSHKIQAVPMIPTGFIFSVPPFHF